MAMFAAILRASSARMAMALVSIFCADVRAIVNSPLTYQHVSAEFTGLSQKSGNRQDQAIKRQDLDTPQGGEFRSLVWSRMRKFSTDRNELRRTMRWRPASHLQGSAKPTKERLHV